MSYEHGEAVAPQLSEVWDQAKAALDMPDRDLVARATDLQHQSLKVVHWIGSKLDQCPTLRFELEVRV
jgi:hypothetical protein